MLLCYRHRFLFIHIAKTGGTSVRAALAPYRRRDPWRALLWACSRMSALSGHRLGIKFPRHAPAIAAREMLPREFYDGLFKFAFVRNPWDLQVSSWHHLRRERPQLVAGCADFADFLRYKLDPQRPWQYHLDTSITPQADYVTDQHGQLIVDFIGRYERLE
ncbi:sulfotransferase family 2 domain-containing protein, partial [Immundisolibacter sp.]|uniref:sulfotransferase family 2 domain-containing protein n=1 Tax=Immundisolibacter sp. TaxID=1934948 RepID=UPI002B26A111